MAIRIKSGLAFEDHILELLDSQSAFVFTMFTKQTYYNPCSHVIYFTKTHVIKFI